MAFKRLLLENADRSSLEARFGTHAFNLWQADRDSFEPSIVEDAVAEAKLDSKYTELKAGAKVTFRGEEYNLPGLGRHLADGDRAIRREANEAFWGWFEQNGESLDQIYDEQVALRAKMAETLGFSDFVELGYKRMHRVDYHREDVQRFREQVRDEVVPLVKRIKDRQAEALA